MFRRPFTRVARTLMGWTTEQDKSIDARVRGLLEETVEHFAGADAEEWSTPAALKAEHWRWRLMQLVDGQALAFETHELLVTRFQFDEKDIQPYVRGLIDRFGEGAVPLIEKLLARLVLQPGYTADPDFDPASVVRTLKHSVPARLTEEGVAAVTQRLLPTFVRALQDPNSLVRLNAARTLGEIGDQGAVEHLVALVRQGEPWDGGIGYGGIGSNRDIQVKQAAIEAMGRLGGSHALTFFAGVLSQEPPLHGRPAWIHQATVEALAVVGRAGQRDEALRLLKGFRFYGCEPVLFSLYNHARNQLEGSTSGGPAPRRPGV